MYKIIPWTAELNLDEFYKQATARGFINNSSQANMIDCFKNETDWAVWILYWNDIAVGSVAAHTIDEGVRICARTCVFSELLPYHTLRTRNQIATHQHVTAQFYMPTCIDWAAGRTMFITSHPSEVGTQRAVHNIWGPTLEKTGVLYKSHERYYRGHVQTFWRLDPDMFLSQLSKYPRWNNQ